MALLEAVDVSKTFRNDGRETPVLQDIRLRIGQGEFISVMGPSGSGKSTLLLTLSGLDRATSGRVLLKGRDLTNLDEDALAVVRLHHVGFVFQHFHLMRNLTLLDNIVLPAWLAGGRDRERILRRAEELMEMTGIARLADRDISQVSGGQLQRAAICRALINDPDILFGDEPTGALNSQSARDIMRLLADINRRGTAILLVTHDPRVASCAERVLFMLDGRLAAEKRLGRPASGSDDEQRERESELTEWLAGLGF
ncbi:ABC-type antimicrobial peptide transport system, ATPase component [Thermobacillus composti KWC4]|uniref:ABC-type antimicrobial peptide transport system, ATPase component n=1 Tax=Thermobacillus composti (strain DSM 18247 / JCM 13945 / KWC4) TaxID=717605 RepID=L0EJ74_THECK|nr:ABC transporter ATP-binding protein [Thermobacillus composti]AGA59664.1 ABC-type antimicrobial peptide transport system, ATPase component [Thermobacillus composti KWC4]